MRFFLPRDFSGTFSWEEYTTLHAVGYYILP